MKRVTRRYRKLIALALFAFQLGGARVHAMTDACDRTHMFFGPCITVKVAIMKMTGQKLERKPSNSLGERRSRHTASDIEIVRRGGRAAPVTVIAATTVAVAAAARSAAPDLLAKLPSDLSPTQPTHLHSKN